MKQRRRKKSTGPPLLGAILIVLAILLVLPALALAYMATVWAFGFEPPPPDGQPVELINKYW